MPKIQHAPPAALAAILPWIAVLIALLSDAPLLGEDAEFDAAPIVPSARIASEGPDVGSARETAAALRALEARFETQQAELQSLKQQLAGSEHQAVSYEYETYGPAQAAWPAAPAQTTTYPSAKLTGFFHLDAGYFSQDEESRASLGDIQDGIGFRRARLAAVGSVAENVDYSIEFDFATAGRPSFMDVWGEVTDVSLFHNVRFGHFRQPFSMTAMNSVRQLQFLERALPFQALVPFRRVGLMAYGHSESELTTWGYSVYRTAAFGDVPIGDTRFATNLTDGGDYSFSTRLTHLVWYDDSADGDRLLHIGGGYNYSQLTENPATGIKAYRAFAIPEFFVGDPTAPGDAPDLRTPNFVDTGLVPADDYHLYGVELAGVYGSFYFQSEFMQTIVNQTGGPALGFEGAYAQMGYFLTGEHRPYNRTQGVFDRVKPYADFFNLHCPGAGLGAWEVAFRWSYIDLNSENVAGGKLNDLTAGLNWYLNPYTRLQFNYIHAMADDRFGPSAGNTDIYAMRWQVDF